ncbi:hypothetical protein D3C87_1624710 [compost metagenome]
MNWTTPVRMPCPIARTTMPKPELDLPLPLPVVITITPRSVCAAEILASTTSFLRAMRALWRASRPSSSEVSGVLLSISLIYEFPVVPFGISAV